ncbi:MAG TPA: hypothetical protein VD837_19875 [Terriglobales bacterium]|nr:hypothetical protein [Terriglobales bacterium]
MAQGGTPPLVPMWPQPHVRTENLNPFPFFPFNPHWGESLLLLELETFCVLLRLAWVSPRPGFLPSDAQALQRLLQPYSGRDMAPVNDRILAHFTTHPRTGLLYFPPQMKALERLIAGENMYALLWDDRC